ncbi:MAG: hypothetical protein K0Q61_3751, partial [Rhodococcus erythropolis]|nr:hypothetical protein [Rhodococcus erythropolis]
TVVVAVSAMPVMSARMHHGGHGGVAAH